MSRSSSRSCTLVSCFYRTPTKKHSFDEYQRWMRLLLATVETPLVIFCEQESVEMIREFRGEHPLTIIVMPFEEMSMMKTPYKEYWQQDYLQDKEKHKQHPMLYAIWNEKFRFVERVVRMNPYKTDLFCWIDIGCFREDSKFVATFRNFPLGKNLDEIEYSKLYLQQVHPFFPADLKILPNGLTRRFDLEDRIGAAVMVGDPAAWYNWNEAYYKTLDEYIRAGYFAGEEQNIMATTVILHPELAFVMTPCGADGVNAPKGDLWFFMREYFSV